MFEYVLNHNYILNSYNGSKSDCERIIEVLEFEKRHLIELLKFNKSLEKEFREKKDLFESCVR